MHIGEKIAELRRINKMTQKELAEKLNLSDKVISKWETGKSLPDVEAMMKLSRVLDVSISELYDSIEQTDVKKVEEYNEVMLWQFKKYNIVSYFLILLSPVFLLLCNASISNNNIIRDVFNYIFIITAIVIYILGLLFQITQYVRLYSYSKTKFYQSEYKKALKKYGIMSILFDLSPALFMGVLGLVINILY